MKPPRVWAPGARKVELVLGSDRVSMERDPTQREPGIGVSPGRASQAPRLGALPPPRMPEGGPEWNGWWWADPPGWGPGVDYAFLLDGEGPFPDPRSPWQPRGVHGPSRTVDHSAFSWNDAGFQAPPLPSALVYELHVGTFSPEGTFEGAARRLDHLVDLGVTHVELMPVAHFPGRRGWGYDGVCLNAPYEAYGGPEGLKRFVDACHGRGLAVLMDVVYNHLGPEGNYLGRFGPYFTDLYSTPWGDAVNLDTGGSHEVRRFLLDNALMWLRDYHIDGLRIDAVHAIFDRSALGFLEELALEVEALANRLGRHLVLIPESDLNDPRLVQSREAGGYGLDAQWSDDFHHALHALLTGERQGYYRDFGDVAHLARALERGWVYEGGYSAYRGRIHGRPFQPREGFRLLGYLQNHDQVGNRATGDRMSALVGPERLRVGAALVLTSPFVPLLFQGEEWGASTPFTYFTDLEDPELGRLVREGRRREFSAFGWDPEEVPDPQDEETFLRSRLDWEEANRTPHRDLLEWHRELVRLRRQVPDLRDGTMPRVRFDEERRWLAVERGQVTVACNLGEESHRIPIPAGRPRSVILASPARPSVSESGVELPRDGVAILAPEWFGKE